MSISLANGVSILYNKELIAGTNITFDVTPTTITINSAGGGGGGQSSIQFQDEGSNLGSAGTATVINFTGAGVTASRSVNTITIDIPGGGSGATWGSITGTLSSQTDLQTALNAKVDTTRTISTTAPLTGGGDLSANRTLGVNTFGAANSGVVPASGGGTTNFLRADGTWAPPPGGGGGSPGGSSGDVQWNDAGTFAGAARVGIDGGDLLLRDSSTDPSAPSSGIRLYTLPQATRRRLKMVGPSGLDTNLQVAVDGNNIFMVGVGNGTTAPTAWGGILTTAATMSTQQTAGAANIWQATRRQRFQTSTTAGNATGARTGYGQWHLSSTANRGGFFFRARFGMNINLNGGQKFIGLCASTAVLAGDPSALTNILGCGYDAADASTGNWFFMHNDGAGVATKIDLGANAARNTTDGYELIMFARPGTLEVNVYIVNLSSGVVLLNTSYNTNIPANNTLLAMKCEVRNGAVAAADNIEMSRIYIETDY